MALRKTITHLGKEFQAYAAITGFPTTKKLKTHEWGVNEEGNPVLIPVETPYYYFDCRVVIDVYTDNTKQYKIPELQINLEGIELAYNAGKVDMADIYNAIKTKPQLEGWEDC